MWSTDGASSERAEFFRDLLLRHRGRSGLTQRQLAERLGVHRRSVQEWEIGASYPGAERLKELIRVLLEAHTLTPGRETAEAAAMWAAVERAARRMHTPFDAAWFARLLAVRTASAAAPVGTVAASGPAERRQDWGEAPDTTGFVGRTDELLTLSNWVVDERCRLVAVLGMGGIGKTSLVAKLAQDMVPSFERVYWRSLRDALPLSQWLAGAIGFLSDQQLLTPGSKAEQLTALLQQLRDRRCLLVMDNLETLFEPGQGDGRYREGLAGYARLLQAAGEVSHQSCLIVTSREAPPELAALSGTAVRTLVLGGLGADETQVLLAPKQLSGTGQQWAELTARFGGNGLALKVISEHIREFFGGDLGSFLEGAGDDSVFGGIRRLLEQQVERSSAPEQQVLQVLAIEREPLSVAGLLSALDPRLGRGPVIEAVQGLRRRSLVERAETPGVVAFTLQSVVLEYVTNRLVADVAEEIQRGQPAVLLDRPLVQAQATDYVRQSQERLIGAPIVQRLQTQGAAEQRLLGLLEGWRGRPLAEQGYGPGNVINLLRLLRGDLRGLDLSHLALRQVYLAQVDAQEASLVGAHLAETVLADAFGLPLSVATTGDGVLLAVGTAAGEVWMWRVADRKPLWAVRGHTGAVWTLAVSTDGDLLASGGADGTVRLWEIDTGRPLATLQGHTGAVWGVALSADGRLLASGSFDRTVRLWETGTRQPLATLQGHAGAIRSVALSADGRLLASGSYDGTVGLWETSTGHPVAALQGHTGAVWGVALSADGHVLASGGADGTVRLWATDTAQPLATLQGHMDAVRGVSLSTDGRLLTSGSEDGTVRLWEIDTGRPLATLQGHTATVRGVALTADGRLLASASYDGTVRLWQTTTGRPVATLQGHTGAVWGVALSADGRLLPSVSADGPVRVWKASNGRLLATLQGHTGAVWSVALSTDGRLLASGGADGTVRVWEADTGRLLATLQGHTGAIRGVALSSDGRLLASGGFDATVRLWEAGTGRPLAALQGNTSAVWGVALSTKGHLLASGGADGTVGLWDTDAARQVATLQGHRATVRGVALSADGRLLATGGEDGTARLWETSTGQPLATLQGPSGGFSSVALSDDGRLLASGGADAMVRLWETSTGQSLATLQGHTGAVWTVALSADGRLLASGSFDGTVRLWEVSSNVCLRVLRPERRYERMDITGLTGIAYAEHSALLALGAVEQQGPGQPADCETAGAASASGRKFGSACDPPPLLTYYAQPPQL